MQIIADYPRVAHFPSAPFLGYRRLDTVFVDIESKIEFLFHWCVCLFELFKLERSGTLVVPAVRAALLHLKKGGVAREKI
jgi:hypothetical protein